MKKQERKNDVQKERAPPFIRIRSQETYLRSDSSETANDGCRRFWVEVKRLPLQPQSSSLSTFSCRLTYNNPTIWFKFEREKEVHVCHVQLSGRQNGSEQGPFKRWPSRGTGAFILRSSKKRDNGEQFEREKKGWRGAGEWTLSSSNKRQHETLELHFFFLCTSAEEHITGV